MIYVPNYQNYACVSVYNNETLRAYETTPTINSNINYTDYFVNSHYLSRDGVQNFSQYSTLPTCINNLTDNFYYRNDFSEVLIVFIILSIFAFYIPLKLLHLAVRGR